MNEFKTSKMKKENDLKRIGKRIAVIETIVFAAFIAVLAIIISIFI